jgi:hypothetical protein
MERMEWVEDLDVLGFCAQGIVSVDCGIHTFTALCRAAACLETGNSGFDRRRDSFCRSEF